MTDLGLYNFIKAQLAGGATKESIIATLEASGTKRDAIDAAFSAVETDIPPMTPGGNAVQAPPTSVSWTAERPLAITIVCVVLAIPWLLSLLGLVGVVSATALAFSSSGSGLSIGFFVFFILPVVIVILSGATIYGYWAMRKWGVQLYTVLFILSSVMNPLGLLKLSVVVPIIALVVGYKYYLDMR